MRKLFSTYRSLSLHGRVLLAVYALAVLVLAFVVPRGAHAQSGNVYAQPQAQFAAPTAAGVVLQVAIREVEPSYRGRAAGAALGSTMGLAAGAASNSRHRYAVAAAVTIVGGVLGERTAHVVARNQAQEIIVQLAPVGYQQPRIVTIVQPAPFDMVFAGEMVYVTTTGAATRVIRQVQQLTAPGTL